MTKTAKQNLKIGIFALCLTVALIFTVFAFLPEKGPVEISGKFTVSSVPIDLSKGTCEVLLHGTLRNKTDGFVTVEQVIVEADGMENALVSEAVVLPPSSEEYVELRSVSDVEVGKVKRVKVVVGGEETELLNPAAGLFGRVWVPCLLTLLFAVLTAHAIVVRIYQRQAARAGLQENDLP